MNKSLLNLFCLILCVTISLVKGKTLISGLILESEDPIPPLVKSCHDKITDKLLSCDEEAKEDWHLTYPWDVRSKAYCCTTWQKFDCIYSNAQMKCTSEEMSEMDKYYNEMIEYLDDGNCSRFPFTRKSEVCVHLTTDP